LVRVCIDLIGGLIALSLVGGFIYLMIMAIRSGRNPVGAGALGMVAGFRSTRLN